MTKNSIPAPMCNDQQSSISWIGTNCRSIAGLILAQLRRLFRRVNRPSRVSALSVFALLVAFNLSSRAATHTWTGASGDGKWSTAFNWSGSSAPVANEAASVVLVFPPAGSKHTTNDLANLTVDQIQITGDNYVIAATGAGTNVTLRSQVFGSTFFISGANAVITNFHFILATNVVNDASLSVSASQTATFRSRFTGPGNLIKRGGGTAVLRGNGANTFTGFTRVEGGRLHLNQTGNAIPGELIIGHPLIGGVGEVELLFQNQIADSAHILVHSNSIFSPSVFTETIGAITLSNANLVAGIGLTLNGAFTSVGTNTVTGTIRLGGANRAFNVTGYLTLDAFIENPTGTAGPIKNGSGVLELKRANTFNGQLTINDGIVRAAHATALGTTGQGTLVAAGGALELAPGLSITNEPLTLTGHGFNTNGNLILRHGSTWQGNVFINPQINDARINVPDPADVGVINGVISGAYLGKIGAGTLRLGGNGDNTCEGMWVRRGTLQLAKPPGLNAVSGELSIGEAVDQQDLAIVQLLASNQIQDHIWVSVLPSGRLSLNGFSERYGATYLTRGRITTGAGTLHLDGDIFVSPVGNNYAESRAFIVGNLTLNAPERGIYVFSNSVGMATLEINGNLTDGSGVSGLRIRGGGWASLIGGTHTYSGVTRVTESSKLTLSYGATPGNPSGGTIVESGSTLLLNDVIAGAEALTLHGDPSGFQSPLSFSGINAWNGPVHLNGQCIIYGFQGDLLTLAGAISGPGTLVKRGAGVLRLTGADDNQLTGGLWVDHGQLELAKSSGATAVPGLLRIGEPGIQNNSSAVILKASHQIANQSPVAIHKGASLDVGVYNDTVGPVTLFGGEIKGSTGLLTLGGDVESLGSGGYFSCRLSLGGVNRKFAVDLNASLTINRDVQDGGGNAGLTKTGWGWMYLDQPTTYAGPTVIDAGVLYLSSGATPGNATGGTVVNSNGCLYLSDVVLLNESLTLHQNENALFSTLFVSGSGTTSNYWGGPVTLHGQPRLGFYSGRTLNLGGVISGAGGFQMGGSGTLHLTGNQPNTYTGPTAINEGHLFLKKNHGPAIAGSLHLKFGTTGKILAANQIGAQSLLTVDAFGYLDLNDFAETIGSLAGEGYVQLGTAQLTIAGTANTVFSGVLAGSGLTSLAHTGAGSLTLAGHSTYTGATLGQGGAIFVTGSVSNSTVQLMNGALLGGTGTVGAISSTGGIISPGARGTAPQYGRLRSLGSVNLGGNSQLRVDLGGTSVGSDLDQLEMLSGALVLPGCTLDVRQHSGGTVSNEYPVLKVVNGGASMGTFLGVAEGAHIISTAGQSFRVNYFAGTGNNDIVLTQLSAATAASFTAIAPVVEGMQLRGLGMPNTGYMIQATTNLAGGIWVDLGVAQANPTGVIQFVDQDAKHHQVRFYRFHQP